MKLHALDWVIVLASLLICFAPALFFGKRADKNTAEVFASGRSVPWWLPEISVRSNDAGNPARESRRFKLRCVKPPTLRPAAASEARNENNDIPVDIPGRVFELDPKKEPLAQP